MSKDFFIDAFTGPSLSLCNGEKEVKSIRVCIWTQQFFLSLLCISAHIHKRKRNAAPLRFLEGMFYLVGFF